MALWLYIFDNYPFSKGIPTSIFSDIALLILKAIVMPLTEEK